MKTGQKAGCEDRCCLKRWKEQPEQNSVDGIKHGVPENTEGCASLELGPCAVRGEHGGQEGESSSDTAWTGRCHSGQQSRTVQGQGGAQANNRKAGSGAWPGLPTSKQLLLHWIMANRHPCILSRAHRKRTKVTCYYFPVWGWG